ncbi:serine/threonine-protein phosphatase 7 long form homolog [Apium graveolens]|uniref:serine/threonine-protein phosphatase 7 long form homolog n=1 Tax=Apium graveolens TaxID=4045 RepID=UPI003D7A1990
MEPTKPFMHPEPRDNSVLHLQKDHRSSIVREVGGGDSQRSRHRNPNNVKFPPLHKRMVPILRDLSFDGVSRLTGIQIDWSLITALIERWRPETHTFHFPIGECMISLQDVSCLLGLRIDGAAVTSFTAVEGGWGKFVEHVFGVFPFKEDELGGQGVGKSGGPLVGGRLKFSWLNLIFPSLPDDASDLQLRRYTQSYILQLIGGVLFTDHSGGQVHCMYIPLIADLDSCAKLSWGSAVLAFLYRDLCKSCRKEKDENAGCLILLQLWAWSRLHTLSPVPRAPNLSNPEIWGDLPGPYGLRWCASLSFIDSGSHALAHFRLSLDVLVDSHFTWKPYSDEILAALPDSCREGSSIWHYQGPLICFYIVEPHLPERCLRQFGMIQAIPSPCTYSNDLHKIDLKGKIDIDWATIHHVHLGHWDSRVQHVFVADVGDGVSHDYYHWYSSITLRYITRIGGGHCYTMDLLDHIESVYKGDIVGDIPTIIDNAKQILSDTFYSGYYQDFPIEDRRAKEVELKGKPKRIPKGNRARVNPPRMRGVLPNVHRDIHIEEDIGDHEGGVHLDDDNEAEVMDEAAAEKATRAAEAAAREARDLSYCPRWNLLPSNDSIYMSPPCEQTEQAGGNQSPPLSHPTFFLFTQSQDPLATQSHLGVNQLQASTHQASLQDQQQPMQTSEHQHQLPVQTPVQQQEVQQQLELQQPAHQQPTQQSVLQQPALKLPMQKLRLPKLPAQKVPPQKQQAKQLATYQQPPEHVQVQQQPAQELQTPQEAPREQLHMKLRARKHAPPGCGTAGKKELDTYKRRNKD